MGFLAAGLRLLNLSVFPLETSGLSFCSHCLLHKVVGTIFHVYPGAEELCGSFNDRACLRECGNLAPAIVLLVMPMRIED